MQNNQFARMYLTFNGIVTTVAEIILICWYLTECGSCTNSYGVFNLETCSQTTCTQIKQPS